MVVITLRKGGPDYLSGSGSILSITDVDGLEGNFFLRSPHIEQGPFQPVKGTCVVDELSRMSVELGNRGIKETEVYVMRRAD